MDFYRNIDKLCEGYGPGIAPLVGLQYSVVQDLEIEPIDIDYFRQHARIDFNVDDNLIPSYITAARQYLEQWSQLSFGRKTIRLMALNLPDNYKLMYGPVDRVEGAEHFGDILLRGGKVDVTYTTKEGASELVKQAIAKYAAGLYAVRENILTDSKGNPVNGENIQDEAKSMLQPIRNATFL